MTNSSFKNIKRRRRRRRKKRKRAGNFKSIAIHEIPMNDGMIPLKQKEQNGFLYYYF